MRGLLPALWSFLQHPGVAFESHLSALEVRIRTLEARLEADFRSAVGTSVGGVEDTLANAEHRIVGDIWRAVDERMSGVQARLQSIKARAVEDLKHELRRLALLLALATGSIVLGLIATVFALMGTWAFLERAAGPFRAATILTVIFLLASLLLLGILRAVLRHPRSPPEVPRLVG